MCQKAVSHWNLCKSCVLWENTHPEPNLRLSPEHLFRFPCSPSLRKAAPPLKNTRWGEKSIFEESQSAFKALYGRKAYIFRSDWIINISMDNNKAMGMITNMRRCQIQIQIHGLSFVSARLHRFYRINPLKNMPSLSKDGTWLNVRRAHSLQLTSPATVYLFTRTNCNSVHGAPLQ